MRHSTRTLQHAVFEGKHKRRSRARRPAVEGLEERALLSAAHDLAVHKHFAVPDPKPVSGYQQTNLVSDIPKEKAQITDPSLVNPWEINFPQDQHDDPYVWVADQGAGVATMYKISSDGSTVTKSPLTVTIPTVAPGKQTGPTGVVYNITEEFSIPGTGGASVPAMYIFDTLQGTIEGWNPGSLGGNSSAEIMVNNSSTAEYTGLAAGNVGGQHYIYAANDKASPGIEVYNGSFDRVTLAGNFVDPKLPKGFTPYGVHDLGNVLIVTYRGPKFQGGAVAEFTNDGTFVKQIASNGASGPLQSPWGVDQAPAGFGKFSNDLLVGNFSTGQIDAYNFSGRFKGKLANPKGKPLTIPGLRTIHFGSGLGASGPKIALLFTAGIDNGNDGLYGTITPVSKPT
ncbi:MAG: TIGR03118 family protein [Isosphaerales bacterium]